MGLMLHAGAVPVDYAGLREYATPAPTSTHFPIPHFSVVDYVKHSLTFFGHEVVQEDYGVTPDGHKFFGVLSLRSPYGDYTDMVGLRNSHDKSFPVGVSFGSRVFCCDNMAFTGEHVIKRRHTPKIKRELPGLIAEIIEPLAFARLAIAQTYDRFKATELDDRNADHLVMDMYRKDIINVTRIADVVRAYDDPPQDFDWGGKTCWRMFNAATYALTGKVAENPKATGVLHDIIDSTCVRLAA
jgi:hypothetical protein